MFANAILFVTVAPEITAITLSPATATVAKGGTLQLNVEATGTGNPSSKCTYAITDNSSDKTFITSTGFLVIGKDETGKAVEKTITITATSVLNEAITDTAVITIP
jgi:hypothetical protein